MDAEDFLDPDEVAAMRRPATAAAPVQETCDGCTIALTWIDPAYVCDQCTWCPDCAEAAAMVCATCSSQMRWRAPRAQPMPRKA